MKYEDAMLLNRKERRKLKFVNVKGDRVQVKGITKPFIKEKDKK